MIDEDAQLKHRVGQIERIRAAGVRSVARVVTCDYGETEWAKRAKKKQEFLLTLSPIIDNPLRAEQSSEHVLKGDIILTRREDSIGGGKLVSLHDQQVYLGTCQACPDQCGIDMSTPQAGQLEIMPETVINDDQLPLFEEKIEFVYVKTVIGSGFEADIAKLAIEDGIAKRAARKNMQIHSAIVLKINDEFSGFFTFQNNDICKEFCLLQSVIKPDRFTTALYSQMVLEVIAQNLNK